MPARRLTSGQNVWVLANKNCYFERKANFLKNAWSFVETSLFIILTNARTGVTKSFWNCELLLVYRL